MAVAKHVTSSIPRRLPDSKSGFRMQNIYLCMLFILFCNTHTHGTPATVYIHCSLFYYSVSIGIGCVEGHGHVEHVDGERHHLLTQILCMTAVCVCACCPVETRQSPIQHGTKRPTDDRPRDQLLDLFFFILFTSASAFTSSIHTTHSCYNIEIYILYISVVAISFAYQKSGDNAVIAACTFRPPAEMHHRCRPAKFASSGRATSAVMLKHVFFFYSIHFLFLSFFLHDHLLLLLLSTFFSLFFCVGRYTSLLLRKILSFFFLLFLFRVQFEFRVKWKCSTWQCIKRGESDSIWFVFLHFFCRCHSCFCYLQKLFFSSHTFKWEIHAEYEMDFAGRFL